MKRPASPFAASVSILAVVLLSSAGAASLAKRNDASDRFNRHFKLPAGPADEASAVTVRPPARLPGYKPPAAVVLFEMSRINARVIGEFRKVWRLCGAGTNSAEGFVLVLMKQDGSYEARSLGLSNEFKKFTFKWDPEIVAIAHTHPNANDPKPAGSDLEVADRYGVPIFTLTNRGMFMYDPSTRKISLLHGGLDWLKPSRWEADGARAENGTHAR